MKFAVRLTDSLIDVRRAEISSHFIPSQGEGYLTQRSADLRILLIRNQGIPRGCIKHGSGHSCTTPDHVILTSDPNSRSPRCVEKAVLSL